MLCLSHDLVFDKRFAIHSTPFMVQNSEVVGESNFKTLKSIKKHSLNN